MQKKHAIYGILISIFLFLIVVPLFNYVSMSMKSKHSFITSAYSKYCYKNGSENKNIKVPIYYESLTECGKPMKN